MNHETDDLKDWLTDEAADEGDLYGFNFTKEIQMIIESLQRIETAMSLIKDKHWYQVKGNLNGN